MMQSRRTRFVHAAEIKFHSDGLAFNTDAWHPQSSTPEKESDVGPFPAGFFIPKCGDGVESPWSSSRHSQYVFVSPWLTIILLLQARIVISTEETHVAMFEHNKGQDTLPSCSVSGTQSHEGCRKDLFKTSQKKGVGYLLLITAFHHSPLGSVCRVQRMPLHVSSVMALQQVSSTISTHHLSSSFIHKEKHQTQHKINPTEESPQSTRMLCLHT